MLKYLGRALLALLYGGGVLSAVFLFLCAVGVLSPQVVADALSISPRPQAAGQTVLSPAVEQAPPAPPERFRQVEPEELDQVRAGEGVVLTMKAPDGQLGYISALELAADCAASSGTAGRNEALYALNQREGVYSVALVSCLRDDALVDHRPALALQRVSGSPWRDAQGGGWLNPASEEVQAYLGGICAELAGLGFDEIVLVDCAYPTEGALACLKPYTDRAQTLEGFCRKLEEEMAQFPVKLSVVGCADYAQADSLSGQTAAVLASFPGRVWAREPEALGAFEAVALP
jgi:hypothetical protein